MSQPGTYPQPASHDPYEQAAAAQGGSAVQQAGYPGSYPTPGSEPAYVQAGCAQQPAYATYPGAAGDVQAGYAAYPAYAGYPGVADYPGFAAAPAARSRTTAALLAFFLGSWGAHDFYRGQMGRGWGHVALGAVSVIIFLIALVVAAGSTPGSDQEALSGLIWIISLLITMGNGIWALVEFIMILVSKDGTLV